jgi:hypothetical protein
VEALLLAFYLLQFPAKSFVRNTHPVPTDQEQDRRNTARQNRKRNQEDGEEHPHGD